MRKILIIKTGFTEFLDRGISTTVSLGDVLICTSLLRLYESDHVTWVVASQAYRLLKDNPHIHELMVFGTETFRALRERSYDIIINLEKDIGICVYLNQIQAKKRIGFFFDDDIHDITVSKPSARYLLSGQENQSDIEKNAFEILFETVDCQWDGLGAILQRPQRKDVVYDLGFNFSVGSKWPTKAWSMDQWKKLEELLGDRFSISWQHGFDDIDQYIDWMDSCRVIVTCDSLGQILAQALGKDVVTLYGATNYKRMERVPGITLVQSPSQCPHRPCYLPICKHDQFCMDEITPESVMKACLKILKEQESPISSTDF